jgi:serine/threonine protein kinase
MNIAKKYKLLKLLNTGSYGSVFVAKSILTNKLVAIKLELKESNMLKREAQIYQLLCGHPGIPKMKYYGSTDTHNFLVLPFLGSSLEAIDFSLEETVSIFKNMINIIEHVHSKGILHRDLKPGNFLYEKNNIYLIDFGLSKKYIDTNGKHISFRATRILTADLHRQKKYTRILAKFKIVGFLLVYTIG